MDIFIPRYWLSLILLTLFIAADATNNDTSTGEPREPRVSGRIVKVYSGTRPEPFLCTNEGFQADRSNCVVFYRCVKEKNGKFTVFRYQCAPGTVFDPDLETCNHPRNTRRTECGGLIKPLASTIESQQANEIDGAQKEVPQPVTTFAPVYSVTSLANQFSTKNPLINYHHLITYTLNPFDTNKHNTPEATTFTTKYPWASIEKQKAVTTERSETSALQASSNDNEICTSDGFTGDANNCRKFYRCVGNLRGGFMKYEFYCSESTVWDDELQSCNHPWAVKRSKCGRSLPYNTEQSSSPSITQIMTTQFNEDGYGYKSNKTVQQQLQISHGSRVTQMQTQISHGDNVSQNQTQINYNDHIKQSNSGAKQNQTQISYGSAVSQSQTQIDYGNKGVQTQLQVDHSKDSSQSQTQLHESTTTQTTSSHQSSHQNGNNDIKCSENGFMGDPNNCKKFYRCVDSGKGTFLKYEYMCGDGTVWDYKIESCNHAWAVKDCGTHSNSELNEEKHTTTTVKSTQSADITRTTQEYHTTSTQRPDTENIDAGYGNQGTNDVTKTPSTTTYKPTTSQNNKEIETTECTSSGFIGDANNCKIFYRCVENGRGFTKHEFKCGDGTLWDPEIEACNHAWAVKACGGSSSNKEEMTTVSTTLITAAVQSTVNLIQTTTESPPPNEDYDNEPKKPASPSITSTNKPQQQDNECKSTGFMGDFRECKKFYRCVDNGNGGYTRHEFTCGEGTVWDPKIEACNHAWAVEKCGGSVSDQDLVTETSTTTVSTKQTTAHTTSTDKSTETPAYTLTSSTTLSITTGSSKGNECQQSGFIGDENNCNKFYRCVDNGDGTYTRFEFTCGEGTVWDPKIEACNHAWAVENCGGSKQPSDVSHPTTSSQPVMHEEESGNDLTTQSYETSSTSQSLSASTTEISSGSGVCYKNGYVGNQNDCKKFYRCVEDGKGGYDRYEFYCGDETVWDDNIQACNHAWAVKECGSNSGSSSDSQKPVHSTTQGSTSTSETDNQSTQESTVKTTSTTYKQENEIINEECVQEGFFGSKNCKKFYRCVDDGKGGFTRYEFTCGEGTAWNQNILSCDHASSDRPCGDETQSTTALPQHINDEIDTETTTKSGSSTTSKNSENSQSTKKPQSSDVCESEGFFGDSNDCKKFYRCVNDGNGSYTKFDFVCGAGTMWNQDIQACDHESDDKQCLSSSSSSSATSNDSTPESSTTSSTNTYDQSTKKPGSEELSTTEECTSDGFYSHPHDCKKFVRCVSNGDGKYTRYEFTCGEGTVWVQEIQACDHDNGLESCNSQSQSTATPQTTQAYSSSSTSSTENQTPSKQDDEYESPKDPQFDESDECSSEGYYGNSKDCTKFYRCVDNGGGGYTKYDFACGEGTAWDADLQTCNHISAVKSCSDSNKEETQSQKPTGSESSESTESSSSTTKQPTSSESSGSSSSSSKDTCEQEGYFGDSQDCKKFYRCVDNGNDGFTKYDFLCGEGTIWDQDITNCNHPQDVSNPSCKANQLGGTSSTSSSGSSTTSSWESTSSTTESNQSPSNCSQENSSKKPGSNQNVTCEKAGYYPDSSNCKKFYRCVDWDGDGKRFSVYHFECGEGTIWDPALDTCNHEESVYPPRDCSQTQSQSQSDTTTTQKTTTSEHTTTEESTTITTEQSTTEQTTTEQSNASEQTTTQESTTSEQTTPQQSTSSEQTTTQQSTTSEQTTAQQTTTSEPKTTQQSTTSEQTTTQQSTTSEQTTTQQSSTSEKTTTQQSTTSEQTTTQQSTTSQLTTTEQTTTNEQTTTQQTTNQESTTTEQTTTQESSTTEQTTTQQSSTSEQTTTEQSTTSEQTTQQTTSEQTTQESTTSQSTTQESSTSEATTQESTTEQSTTEQTENSLTTASTTESTTDSSGTTTESEQESTTNKECPDTEDDQYLLVCPTPSRRHPKYCNMFYQCTEDDDTHDVRVAMFKCPDDTIYDESQMQCLEEKKATQKCDGEMARKQRYKRLSSKEPIEVDREKKSCPNIGYYPFEKTECSPAFLKCEKLKTGKLRGYVNQCPKGYIFWSISKRCELIESVKDCKRSTNDWKGRWNVPIERKNIAV